MAKITRAHQKVFCDGVAATENIAKFGSLKAAAVVYSKDPAVIQALAAYDEGWASAVVANNAPAMQDENALFFLITRQLAYLFQAGIAEWDADTVYYTGSFCSSAGIVYRSLVADNTDNAVTDTAYWSAQRIPALTISINGTLDAALASTFVHSGSGSREITVSNLADGQEIIVNVNGASPNAITWATSGLTQKTGTGFSGTMTSAISIFRLARIGTNVFISATHGYS